MLLHCCEVIVLVMNETKINLNYSKVENNNEHDVKVDDEVEVEW